MIAWKQYMENKYLREVFVFVFLLILNFINDRDDFISSHVVLDELFIFFLLYLHVQFQRFVILPVLSKQQYSKFFICCMGTVFLFSVFALLIDYYFTDLGWYDEFIGNRNSLFKYYLSSFSITVILLLLLYFVINFYKQKHLESKLSLLLKEMELQHLKTQTNPHFLFNALNSLYGISLEKPEEVSEKILQMSNVMRYQLELSKKDLISLLEELDFLRQYMVLEEERICANTVVTIGVDFDHDEVERFQIAPMLLIFFIENAFKHVGQNTTGNYLNIHLNFKENNLSLMIDNSVNVFHTNRNSLAIGLNNVHKRLNLLYPGRFSLEQGLHDDIFEVRFQLWFPNSKKN